MSTILIKIFATALVLSQVTTRPDAVKPEFDPVKDQPAVVQILGAYGYTMEFDMQRHFRDSRASTIAAGTSQMQRNLIANLMGLKVQ